MTQASRETWARRVERWRDSGLSAKAFAVASGLNPKTLQYWSWRLAADRRRSGKPAAELPFVEVAPAALRAVSPATTTDKLELVLANGCIVRIPEHFDAESLRRLLAVVA